MHLSKQFFKYGIYYPVVAYKAGDIRAPLRRLRATERQPRDLMNTHNLARLQTLLHHAYQYVPLFREKLNAQHAPRVEDLSDLKYVPLLTKQEIQSDAERCRSNQPLGRLISKTTGGSTGQPVTIYKTRSAWLWELAATWRGYGWAGIDIGDPQARFWGVPLHKDARLQARLTDFVCHRYRCSAFAFDEADLARYLRELNRFRPAWFYGYVSMLSEFADYVLSSPERWRLALTCVITTSEVLTQTVREKLSQAFHAPVFNEYGCGELGTIAHECEAGSMHISEENMLVEILDGDRVCSPGEMGEIVVTELNNYAMPLIRYRTGDFGSISAGSCSCGRTLAVLEGLYGRAYDMVRTRRGQSFHGEFMIYIFENIKRRQAGIKQFQVVQQDLDRFLVRIVPEQGYGPAVESEITREIRANVDPDANVLFEQVSAIERAASGKMRVIVGMGR
ncbi:MAG: hypothetical protein R3F42_14845 [Pseudomonadota bacterium]